MTTILLQFVLRLRDALQDFDTWIFFNWESKLRARIKKLYEEKQ